MTASIIGPAGWSASRDREGRRQLRLTWKIATTDPGDGPITVMNTPGLFAIGSTWSLDNDADSWLFCSPQIEVSPFQQRKDDPVLFWLATQFFETPDPNRKRCQDESVEDPLLEPDRVGGSFVNYTQEVSHDRFGDPILTSSHEQIRGSIVEFDFHKPTVQIGQNRSTLGLDTFSSVMNHVNSTSMWGLSPRMVKFSNVTWSRQVYGTCSFYYVKNFDFDIDFNTFDRVALDEGEMVLNGRWECGSWVLEDVDLGGECGEGTGGTTPPDPQNPLHFIRFKDRNGENARVVLNGAGVPATIGTTTGTGSGTSNIGTIPIEYYPEADLLTVLDLPASLTS